MAGYSKLFSCLTTSTIWCQDHPTRIVWITMLATCDSDGFVEGSIPGFANLARVTISEMEHALEILKGPDPYSRTQANEGRRIEDVPGGWRILNYADYRNRGQSQEGSRAPYMRSRRAAKKGNGNDV
jgi:hypothetical protein